MKPVLALSCLCLLATSCSSTTTVNGLVVDLPTAPTPGTPSAWSESRGEILRSFAWRALERDMIPEAKRYLREACDVDASDGASHSALARLYLSEGDVRASLAFAEKAVSADPTDPSAHMVYAAALMENREPEAAGNALRLGWQLSGQDPLLARAVMTHHASTGQGETANDFVEHLLTENSEEAVHWAIAGDLYLAEGQLDAAAAAWSEALTRNSDLPAPRVLAGRLGLDLSAGDPVKAAALKAEAAGDFSAAERLFQFLAEAGHSDAKSIAGLARVLSSLGRHQEARLALRRLAPDQRTWREQLLDARLSIREGRPAAARGILLALLESRPQLRAARLLLEHLQQKEGGRMQ